MKCICYSKRYGLWVFSMDGYFPKNNENGCGGGKDQTAVWRDFTVWNVDRGAEVVFGGNLQFDNFVGLDCENALFEMVKVNGQLNEDGPGTLHVAKFPNHI